MDYKYGVNLGGTFFVIVIVILGIFLAAYVIGAVAYQRGLRLCGYSKPWMAWIPFARQYALADAVGDADGNTTVLGFQIPSMVFNFWWVLQIAANWIPSVGTVISLVIGVICMGSCFGKMYSAIEGKAEEDTVAIGYVSGIFPIVAIVKFLAAKE